MVRTLKRIGNSKGLILSPDMLDHLGVDDAVEVAFESGRLVITAPAPGAVHPGRRLSFDDAAAATEQQFDDALRNLAK